MNDKSTEIRKEYDPPIVVENWGWKYHHIGIPTFEKMPVATMYKNNSRANSKFKACSSLQLHRKLKAYHSAVGNFSYTHR